MQVYDIGKCMLFPSSYVMASVIMLGRFDVVLLRQP